MTPLSSMTPSRSSGGAIDYSAFDLLALPLVRSWFGRLSVSF